MIQSTSLDFRYSRDEKLGVEMLGIPLVDPGLLILIFVPLADTKFTQFRDESSRENLHIACGSFSETSCRGFSFIIYYNYPISSLEEPR